MDGVYWVNESRVKFQKIINTLNQHSSSRLKILITSQQEIKANHKYRPHHLSPLHTNDCVDLFEDLVSDHTVNVSQSDLKTICNLVGNIPLAIKVISGSQKFSTNNVKKTSGDGVTAAEILIKQSQF